jgi:G2/mitotic-specific cyclin-B, other
MLIECVLASIRNGQVLPSCPGKQKAGAAAARTGARNPLGDIGNLVVPEGINCPITRSFGAQLLKKAQANAALVRG